MDGFQVIGKKRVSWKPLIQKRFMGVSKKSCCFLLLWVVEKKQKKIEAFR